MSSRTKRNLWAQLASIAKHSYNTLSVMRGTGRTQESRPGAKLDVRLLPGSTNDWRQAQIHLLGLSVTVALSATSRFQSLFKAWFVWIKGHNTFTRDAYFCIEFERSALEAAERQQLSKEARVLHFDRLESVWVIVRCQEEDEGSPFLCKQQLLCTFYLTYIRVPCMAG